MKTKHVQLKDLSIAKRSLNKTTIILVIIAIILVLVDLDLFHPNPRWLKTDGYFYKGMAILFQVTFIANFIQWEFKKKKILSLLQNGIITNGTLKFSESFQPNSTSRRIHVHMLAYNANEKSYEISTKSKRRELSTTKVLYLSNEPKKAIAIQELKPAIQQLIL